MRTRKIIKYILIGFLALSFIFILLAPTLIKAYINKNGKEYAGRALNIDKLRVNYFSSTIRVIGFSLFEKDDTTEFIGFDTLSVNLKPLRLLSNEFHIQQLLLVNPRGIILQNDTVFNFDDLMSQSDTIENEDVASDTAVALPYKLNLNQLEMRNGNFAYTDEQLEHTIHINSLSFIIPQIYWNAADSSKAGLAFDLSEGGHFESNMSYKVETGDFHGNIDIGGLELATFLPYMQQYMNFSSIEGTLDTHLAFSGSSEDMEILNVQGGISINNVIVEDDGKMVLGVVKYAATFKEIKPLQAYYELGVMEITEPYIYFSMIDSTSNFENILVEPNDTITSESQDSISGEPEMFVRLNQFIIKNGLIDFSDQRMQNKFNYELSEVNLDMDTLDLVDNWVNLVSTMKLNKRGKMEVQLGLNPTDMMDSLQLDYVVSDFQLPDLNIYSKHYVGLPILFGDMYYVSKTSIVHKQLVSDNKLIIRNVDMGRKAGGLYDVPMKLALFILKDINGDIELEIPVKGDFDDPQTKVGPIIFNTLKNLVFKIVASPFKALGGLLGADPDELSEIVFDYADTTLTNKHQRSLSFLLKLEEEKPELQTDLVYLNDRGLERLDAAREISHKMYWDKHHKVASSNMKDYEKFLQKATGKDSLVLQDYEIICAPKLMIDSLVEQREVLRFIKVSNFLKENNDSSQIRLIPYNSAQILNKGSRPHFEVKVNLAEGQE